MSGHGKPGGGIVLRRADGTAMTRDEVIIMRRGAFKWLPVLCSNDLVHGSWWMVWGSLGCAVFAVVPLIQQYLTFYSQHDDLLPAVDFKLTWALLIFSGIFFTLGSLAFVRAFGEPPRRALFYWYRHFQTDELLGAWLFLMGTVPSIPYTLVFFLINPDFTYLGALSGSGVGVVGTILFVLACYPSQKKTENYILPIFLRIFGARLFIVKHLANDWLAGTWFFFWANALFTFFSFVCLIAATAYSGDAEQVFIWLSSAFSSLLFLIGSMYFVSGSYPHAQQFYYIAGRGRADSAPTHTHADPETGSKAPDGPGEQDEHGVNNPLLKKCNVSFAPSTNDNSSAVPLADKTIELTQPSGGPKPVSGAVDEAGGQLASSVMIFQQKGNDTNNPLHQPISSSSSTNKTSAGAAIVNAAPISPASVLSTASPSAAMLARTAPPPPPLPSFLHVDEDENRDDDDDEVDHDREQHIGRVQLSQLMGGAKRK